MNEFQDVETAKLKEVTTDSNTNSPVAYKPNKNIKEVPKYSIAIDKSETSLRPRSTTPVNL